MERSQLGKKIVIVGVSAAGKSTFARKLTAITKLPLIFMDSIMWNPGWDYIGDDATNEKLQELSQANEWIIEGYITTAARSFIFERADTIIYLDYPRIVASYRYLKRWLKHRKSPRPEIEGCPEKFDFTFLKLVWTKGEAMTLNTLLARIENQNKIIKLESPTKTAVFLKNLH
ncbi:MAG: topology modulation protein [Parcubacteria group bacterium]|nr:topology modulation protein [Parcubacteria group bacterium]